jgi:hypothetical protein
VTALEKGVRSAVHALRVNVLLRDGLVHGRGIVGERLRSVMLGETESANRESAVRRFSSTTSMLTGAPRKALALREGHPAHHLGQPNQDRATHERDPRGSRRATDARSWTDPAAVGTPWTRVRPLRFARRARRIGPRSRAFVNIGERERPRLAVVPVTPHRAAAGGRPSSERPA